MSFDGTNLLDDRDGDVILGVMCSRGLPAEDIHISHENAVRWLWNFVMGLIFTNIPVVISTFIKIVTVSRSLNHCFDVRLSKLHNRATPMLHAPLLQTRSETSHV